MAALNPKFFTTKHYIVLIGLSVAMLIFGVAIGYYLGYYTIYGFPSYPQVNGYVSYS